jgi:hypothetical protein
MAKEIILTQGKVAIVDDDMYDYLNQWKWFANLQGKKFYARTNIPNKKGKRGSMLMHRLILNMLNSKLQVDHLNHYTLDNRKCNIRICTQSDNLKNRIINKNNSTGYKGVVYNKSNKKFIAKIGVNKNIIYIGCFIDPKDAAKAYNAAALKYHGEFANLNKID